MVVTMPDKALWESAFVFLASWLGDIFTVSLRLRGIMMLQETSGDRGVHRIPPPDTAPSLHAQNQPFREPLHHEKPRL